MGFFYHCLYSQTQLTYIFILSCVVADFLILVYGKRSGICGIFRIQVPDEIILGQKTAVESSVYVVIR